MFDKKRKVIQLLSYGGKLVALCDDGTIWEEYTPTGKRPEWQRRADVPQPERGSSGVVRPDYAPPAPPPRHGGRAPMPYAPPPAPSPYGWRDG